MLQNGMHPTVFFANPNIFPQQEYAKRKAELIRFLEAQDVPFIEDDYDHEAWLASVKGLETEPERGRRCQQCFRLRLLTTARKAQELGIHYFATTLASSRWKSLEQISLAGQAAQDAVPGTEFWAQNWRKGGLQERRNQLLREYNFYNQQYCGCEFSVRPSTD
jgi:predicted adenine nucleotide alpha hydrolase (AANH) superfamily ATPase